MNRPTAWIIATGEELIGGGVIDTNSSMVAEALALAGCRVSRHLTVGDEIGELTQVLREAAGRARVVVFTGGLGPTDDDLTREAAAEAFDAPLELDEAQLDSLKKFFETRGYAMPESNRKQALLPKGSEKLPNPVGTACGFSLEKSGTRFYFAPGVPSELERMLAAEIVPRARRDVIGPATPRKSLVLRTFGLPESRLGEALSGVGGAGVTVGYRAVFPLIDVKLAALGESAEEAEERLERAKRDVFSRVGEQVYAEGKKTLAGAVGELLRSEGATLTLAESCTGGLISKLLTDVPGSSDYFERGLVTYSNEAKVELLGVKRETLEAHGAVSEAVVLEMAEGARQRAGATYAVAVTGVAGPGGGSAEKPVGAVWLAFSSPTGTRAKMRRFGGDREKVRLVAAYGALDWVRRRLLGLG